MYQSVRHSTMTTFFLPFIHSFIHSFIHLFIFIAQNGRNTATKTISYKSRQTANTMQKSSARRLLQHPQNQRSAPVCLMNHMSLIVLLHPPQIKWNIHCNLMFFVAATSASNQCVHSLQQETSSCRRTPVPELQPKHDQKDHGRLVESAWKQ